MSKIQMFIEFITRTRDSIGFEPSYINLYKIKHSLVIGKTQFQILLVHVDLTSDYKDLYNFIISSCP